MNPHGAFLYLIIEKTNTEEASNKQSACSHWRVMPNTLRHQGCSHA